MNVGWLDVLHYCLVDVPRGHCKLTDGSNGDKPQGVTCLLQTSVPFHPFIPNQNDKFIITNLQSYYTMLVAGYQQEYLQRNNTFGIFQ